MRSRWLKRALAAAAFMSFTGIEVLEQSALAQTQTAPPPPVIGGWWTDFNGFYKTAKEACILGHSPRHTEVFPDERATNKYGSIYRAYCDMKESLNDGHALVIQAACAPNESQAGNSNIFPLDYVFLGGLEGGICALPSAIKEATASDAGYEDTPLSGGGKPTPICKGRNIATIISCTIINALSSRGIRTPQQSKHVTNIEMPGGGFKQANRDFDEMGLKNVHDRGFGLRTGELPDGRVVNVRPWSKSTKQPTVEIINHDGTYIAHRYPE